MINSKLVQTRTKVNKNPKNSTTHVTYLSFLCSELFSRCLEQKIDPWSLQVWYFSLFFLPLRLTGFCLKSKNQKYPITFCNIHIEIRCLKSSAKAKNRRSMFAFSDFLARTPFDNFVRNFVCWKLNWGACLDSDINSKLLILTVKIDNFRIGCIW